MEEKHPQTIAAVGEYEFPEEIIHQIQSFMVEREAARTTLVSKSWYGAWSTRPNLSFVPYEWGGRFREYARKTLQRYEHLNLNIHTFRLRLDIDLSLARELILKAIKLGVVDLTIDVMAAFVLPDEVLQSQTLATLSVEFVTVDLERMINKPLITSSNLKSLTLSSTVTIGDFSYLSRRFPLLEELTMQYSHLYTEDSLSKSDSWIQFPCLKTLVIRNCLIEYKAKLEFDVPNIRKFEFKGDDVPRLELKTSSREWESDIRITCWAYMRSVSWLRSLKQFVKLLSPSRVSLALHMIQPQGGDQNGFVGDDLAVPAVEYLTISGAEVSPAFTNALFRTFRPIH